MKSIEFTPANDTIMYSMTIGLSAGFYPELSLRGVSELALKHTLIGVEADLPRNFGDLLILPEGVNVLSIHLPPVPTLLSTIIGCELAKRLGVPIVVCHPTINPSFARFFNAYYSLFDVTLTIENVPPLLNRREELKLKGINTAYLYPESEVYARYWGLPLTLDIGHAYLHGMDPSTLLQDYRHRVVHIHAHDVREGIDHVALGTGEIPLVDFFDTLREINYNGSIILENNDPVEPQLKYLYNL